MVCETMFWMEIKMYGATTTTLHCILIVLPFIAVLNAVKVRTAFHFTSFTLPAVLRGSKMSIKHSRRAIGCLSRLVIYTQVAFLFRNTGMCSALVDTSVFGVVLGCVFMMVMLVGGGRLGRINGTLSKDLG